MTILLWVLTAEYAALSLGFLVAGDAPRACYFLGAVLINLGVTFAS